MATHFLFLLMRLLPFWSFPSALISFQLALHFRRKLSPWYRLLALVALALLSMLGAWIYYRGDLHSDAWVRTILTE